MEKDLPLLNGTIRWAAATNPKIDRKGEKHKMRSVQRRTDRRKWGGGGEGRWTRTHE